jgi:hypothetical protein
MGKRFNRIAQGLILIITLGLCINVAFASALPQQNNHIYLPLLLNGYPPPPILFPNGDFEQGPKIWTEFSTHGYELITKDLSIYPYDGQWSAWLGGVYDEVSYIEQQVTVPNNLRYLSYWHAIYSADTCGNDFERVLVNSNEVFAFDLCEPNDTNGWAQIVIDLSAYAGQSVLIQIRAECNATLNSNLFIDHVGFQYSSSITNHPPEDITVIKASSLKSDLLGK